jgi:hypothetical protein
VLEQNDAPNDALATATLRARATVIATVNSWVICRGAQENHTDPARIMYANLRPRVAAHNDTLDGLQKPGAALHNRRSRARSLWGATTRFGSYSGEFLPEL